MKKKENNITHTSPEPIKKETLKPKTKKKLNETELRELIIKETKENIEGKFLTFINFKLYWLSKDPNVSFNSLETELKKILGLHNKMYEVLDGINNYKILGG